MFISVQGWGEVERFLIILLVNSFDHQKRAGGVEGLTSEPWITDRSQRTCPNALNTSLTAPILARLEMKDKP